MSWNTVDASACNVKTGHAFIKERIRTEEAIYGREMRVHHYFRDFSYCDSGLIPWLLVAELVSVKGKTLGQWVQDRIAAYPSSGGLNIKLAQPAVSIESVEQHYLAHADEVGLHRWYQHDVCKLAFHSAFLQYGAGGAS